MNSVELTPQNPNTLTAEGPEVRIRPVGPIASTVDADELIAAYVAGATAAELAERYDVSKSSVKAILRERGARKRGDNAEVDGGAPS